MSRKRARRTQRSTEGLIALGLLTIGWAWTSNQLGWIVLIAAAVAVWLAFRALSKPPMTVTSPTTTPAPGTALSRKGSRQTFSAAVPTIADEADVDTEDWDGDLSLYSLRRTFFNRTENAFYRSLLRAVDTRYWIFPKVRLLDICNDIPGNVYSARNRIWARHVDFLLCHPVSLKPVAAIEVDGPSHRRRDRVESDAFKDALSQQLGLPLIRVPAASWFEPADVLRRIQAVLPADQLRLPD